MALITGKMVGKRMMPKYTDISISSEVYVDSQCNYHFRVRAQHWGKRGGGWVYQTGFGMEDFEDAPQYLLRRVRESVVQVLKDPKTIFHEYDQQRTKRYTNLRYHSEPTRRFQVRAASLRVARDNEPKAVTGVTFASEIDPVWGTPVWVPSTPCFSCKEVLSDHKGKSLGYYHAPVVILASHCWLCDLRTVCLLNDLHWVVATYAMDEWELLEWPLYYEV